MSNPTPVTQLSYYEPSTEPWRSTTGMVTLIAIIESALTLLAFAVSIGLTIWEAIIPASTTNRISFGSSWQLIITFPAVAAAGLMLIGAILTLKGRSGRKMLMTGALGLMIFNLMSSAANEIFFAVRYLSRGGAVPMTAHILYIFLFSLKGCLLPGFIWYYFRLPQVKEFLKLQPG